MTLEANDMFEGVLWQGIFPSDVADVDGFDDIVMCAPLRDTEPREVLGRLPPGVGAYTFPFSDDIQPPSPRELETIRAAVSTVVSHVQAGRRVLVTCREGKNRSGLVVALALKEMRGITGSEALVQVQVRRPGSLYNYYFQQIVLS